MSRYIIKRILWMIPIILGVLLIVFTISYFTPGDPVKAILGTGYTPEAYAAKRIELGLDKPFLEQFVRYIVNLFKGDMGVSYTYGHSVAGEISTRIGITLKIGIIQDQVIRDLIPIQRFCRKATDCRRGADLCHAR